MDTIAVFMTLKQDGFCCFTCTLQMGTNAIEHIMTAACNSCVNDTRITCPRTLCLLFVVI